MLNWMFEIELFIYIKWMCHLFTYKDWYLIKLKQLTKINSQSLLQFPVDHLTHAVFPSLEFVLC